MKRARAALLAGVCSIALFFSCQRNKSDVENLSFEKTAIGANKATKTKMDVPVLNCATSTQASINIQVCAGATGAPAGFTIQWMTYDAYVANGGWVSGANCEASFSGNANNSRYNLAPNACVTVNIGEFLFDNGASTSCPDQLMCGTRYVFRAFAHANSSLFKSDFTSNLQCNTLPCQSAGICTYTQGYWKTHGPEGCAAGNNTNMWPVTSMTLGTVNYTDLQLCVIFNTPASGNGLISLAHQLIAAKMNIARGSDPAVIAATIASADAMIGGLVVPPVGGGTLDPAVTSALITALTNYNEGATGPGHCN